MWTTHVMYWLALALAVWIAYRVGIAVEAQRAGDDLTVMEDERDSARDEVTHLGDVVASLERSRTRWRRAAVASDSALTRERTLTARLMERLLPTVADDASEPLTMAEADRLAVETRRKELERENAMVYDGREPILVQDSDTEPPPRLVAVDAGDGDGDAP